MSDNPLGSSAWHVDPVQYLEKRGCDWDLPDRPRSYYLTMRDGVRIAIDVYLPSSGRKPESRRWPTIVIATPYYRRFALTNDAPAETENTPNAVRYRDMFVPRGYALVVLDVRGSGASFGSRDSFRSPKEREDFHEVAEWIIGQDWSDGSIGATGISYLGAAADFLASTGHPAIKAIAPICAVWDTWLDQFHPGGVLLCSLAETYAEYMTALDRDQRVLLRKFAYFKDPHLAGPAPVDEDENGNLLAQAMAQHEANISLPDYIREFPFRDSALAYDSDITAASFSPFNYASGIRKDVAVLSISGWYDGGGYVNGAISRFLSLPNARKHLLLGPWDHGARINGSPFRRGAAVEFPVLGEVLRFFDHYLGGRPSGYDAEAPVHYFTLGAEGWKSSEVWPPRSKSKSFFLTKDGTLSLEAPQDGTFAYDVSYATGSGRQTRYERIAGLDISNYYSDWQHRDGMACFTSEPLNEDLELAGHPIVDLMLESDQPDATVFAYIEDVGPDGSVRYVTEGVLRALHRHEGELEPLNQRPEPTRTYLRTDAAPLTVGLPERLRFSTLPVSWLFKVGHRIRLSLAGADKDHFICLPHGHPGRWTIHVGLRAASKIELPFIS